MTALVNLKTNEIVAHHVEARPLKLPTGNVVLGAAEGWSDGTYALVPVVRDDTMPAGRKRTGESVAFDGTQVTITATHGPLSADEIAIRDADIAYSEITHDLGAILEAIISELPGPVRTANAAVFDAFATRRAKQKARP